MSFKNHKKMKEEQPKNLIYATYVNDMVLMLNGFSEGSFGQKQHAQFKKNTKEIKNNIKELDKYPKKKSLLQLIDIKDDHK